MGYPRLIRAVRGRVGPWFIGGRMPGGGTVIVKVAAEGDVARARREAVAQATRIAMDPYAREALAISVSEVATNQLRYAVGGQIRVDVVERDGRRGVEVEARDEGPGISDLARAMEDGYSTGGSIGGGLGAVRRLMDDLDIDTEVGKGTRILMRKWAAGPGTGGGR